MSLYAGDLTTPQRAAVWLAGAPTLPSPLISQLITSMTALIYSKLNRPRVYSQIFSRTFDGNGNYQILLPDYPVTAISSVQMGASLLQSYPLPSATTAIPINTFGYGWRFPPWDVNLPGVQAMLELVNGIWYVGAQNIRVVYTAGYLIQNEAQIVSADPFQITVNQLQGIWSHDCGVSYADTGIALVPVTSAPSLGQYIPPVDSAPGVYTFSSDDAGANLLFNYSFIPADLEEACIQMVAERISYRDRIGIVSKSLGGQETMRYMRGGSRNGPMLGLPPEVESLLWPYVNVVLPTIGAPL